MNKEAIELLEKAKKALHYQSTGFDYIDQALTISKQPECKTCDDTKRVPTKQSAGFGSENAIMQACPDCQQPIAMITLFERNRKMRCIEKNHGHWQLRGDLREMLMECRAESSTRYAIEGICVGENTLAVTDGRRLVELRIEHKIPEATYFCTVDGFLLDVVDGNFPKYRDIIPDKTKSKIIVDVSSGEGVGDYIIGLILGKLCHAGCIIKLSLYENPIKILSKVIAGRCRVYIHETEPRERPFMIEAETSIGNLIYIQMPIDVKNEA